MIKVAYFDCPTGVAGDMCLGALLDVGVPLDYLQTQLDRLGIAGEYRLSSAVVQHNGQRALKAVVELRSPDQSFQVEGPGGRLHSSRVESPGVDHSRSQSDHDHAREGHDHDHVHRHHDHVQGHEQVHRHLHTHHDHDHEHHHEPVGHNSDWLLGSGHAHGRRWPTIEAMLLASELPARVVMWSRLIFWQLAQAEGSVHGIPPEQVQFHEVGAIDAIVDVVGTCLGLDWLGIDRVVFSPLPTGGGTVWAAHGRLPVPVPAVLKLFELGSVPVYPNGIDRELVTPTGAAIAVGLADGFGPPPAMRIQKVGLGAGTIQLPLPNMVRLWLGDVDDRASHRPRDPQRTPGADPTLPMPSGPASPPAADPIAPVSDPSLETVAVLETQIDDCSPQAIAYAIERLLQAGALDAFVQPVTMKKSRTGVAVTAICPIALLTTCEDVLFQETTTIGIRRSFQQRRVLPRQLEVVDTAYGPVRVKVAWQDETRQTVQNIHPEFEDVAALARDQSISWLDIHRAAWIAWEEARRANDFGH